MSVEFNPDAFLNPEIFPNIDLRGPEIVIVKPVLIAEESQDFRVPEIVIVKPVLIAEESQDSPASSSTELTSSPDELEDDILFCDEELEDDKPSTRAPQDPLIVESRVVFVRAFKRYLGWTDDRLYSSDDMVKFGTDAEIKFFKGSSVQTLEALVTIVANFKAAAAAKEVFDHLPKRRLYYLKNVLSPRLHAVAINLLLENKMSISALMDGRRAVLAAFIEHGFAFQPITLNDVTWILYDIATKMRSRTPDGDLDKDEIYRVIAKELVFTGPGERLDDKINAVCAYVDNTLLRLPKSLRARRSKHKVVAVFLTAYDRFAKPGVEFVDAIKKTEEVTGIKTTNEIIMHAQAVHDEKNKKKKKKC
jgi:hypothetical protein